MNLTKVKNKTNSRCKIRLKKENEYISYCIKYEMPKLCILK